MQVTCVHPAARHATPLCLHVASQQQLWPGYAAALLRAKCLPNARRFSANRRRGGGTLGGGTRFKRPLAFIVANGQAEQPEEGGDDDKEGDKKVQDMLVGMVRLQTGKLRVSEFVDERSKLLSDIAEQAKEEYDKIAQDAMRSMDEASSKIISSVEEEAQALEEELASARAEMEADSRDLDEFEENVDKARSEGLFFKGLYGKPLKSWKERTPEEKEEIKEQAEVVANVAKKSAVSQSRRFLYGVLIFLLSLTLVEAISSGDVQWPKLALYFVVLVALVAQLSYEKFVASDGEDDSTKK